MTFTFNTRQEVTDILGRAMTTEEDCAFRIMRSVGYANPFDIVAAFPRYIAELPQHVQTLIDLQTSDDGE